MGGLLSDVYLAFILFVEPFYQKNFLADQSFHQGRLLALASVRAGRGGDVVVWLRHDGTERSTRDSYAFFLGSLSGSFAFRSGHVTSSSGLNHPCSSKSSTGKVVKVPGLEPANNCSVV